MKHKLVYIFIFCPLLSFSQLDSLKGKIKSLKQTTTYTETFLVKGILYHREFDDGQFSFNYENIFDEFPKELYPNRSTNYEKKI